MYKSLPFLSNLLSSDILTEYKGWRAKWQVALRGQALDSTEVSSNPSPVTAGGCFSSLPPTPALSNSRISWGLMWGFHGMELVKAPAPSVTRGKHSINKSYFRPYVLSINVPRGCLFLVDFFFFFLFVFFLWPRNHRLAKLNETFIFNYFKRLLFCHHKTCQLAELESWCQWV